MLNSRVAASICSKQTRLKRGNDLQAEEDRLKLRRIFGLTEDLRFLHLHVPVMSNLTLQFQFLGLLRCL